MSDRINENSRLRDRSGNVIDNDPLTSFLYDLLRDHVNPSTVEKLVRDSRADSAPFVYSNGYLARYAQDLAGRLRGDIK